MRLSAIGVFLACGLVAVAGPPARAQVRQFPYEAVVESDNVSVRSGPSDRYYPTGVLQRGERVTVHRHDPGAWYMIAPPAGSFSWIRAEHVRRLDAGRGAVTANDVVVRVGSTFGDAHEVWQSRLSSGDVVEILGEATLTLDGQPMRMYKIKPPRDEYRWIAGRFVVPVDQIVRQQQDRDPFAVPSNARRPRQAGPPPALEQLPPATVDAPPAESTSDSGFVERPLVRTREDAAGPERVQTDAAAEAQRGRLKELDDRFRRMLKQDTADWNVDDLERGYRQLGAEALDPALAAELQRRFPALDKYKRIKSEYDDLMRLTSETNRRDAQLLSIQRQKADAPDPGGPTVAPAPAVRQPDPFAAQQGPGSTPSSGVPAAAPADSRMPPPGLPARNLPRFDGAGIIQRVANAAPGSPQHVLVTPDGRILAYLHAARGINLDRYLGQSMGLFGERFRHPSLQADFITVRGLTPVRLAK